jgi:hypothetical protein
MATESRGPLTITSSAFSTPIARHALEQKEVEKGSMSSGIFAQDSLPLRPCLLRPYRIGVGGSRYLTAAKASKRILQRSRWPVNCGC